MSLIEDLCVFPVQVRIVLVPGGRAPEYATEGAAGADAFARIDQEFITVYPGCAVRVPLGFRCELPPGWELQVRGRSGITSRDVWVALGTVDSDYRGEVMALVKNFRPKKIRIPDGVRIAQLVVARAPQVQWVEVTGLSETRRSIAGHGSTGGEPEYEP